MSDLRTRKKQKTRVAILKAARGLMIRQGFEATTMENVAARADVSVGSLYNYFENKRALLLGIMEDATEDVLQEAASVVANPGNNGQEALAQLLHGYATSLQKLNKDLLRQTMSISFTEPPENTASMFRLDEMLIEQTALLVAQLQQRSLITTEVSVEQASLTLYGTFAVAMLLWMSMPDADNELLHSTLDQQLFVVFRGLTPLRSERRNHESSYQWNGGRWTNVGVLASYLRT
jgi:AcrR family transcriptional regulator